MKHRRWRELFERLPPEIQAEVNRNTAKVLAELDRDQPEQRDEQNLYRDEQVARWDAEDALPDRERTRILDRLPTSKATSR